MPRAAALTAAALPLLAAAATGGLDAALDAITVREWLALAGIATFGGLASLIWRLAASQEARFARSEGRPYREGDIVRVTLPLFVASHMAGAWVAGLTAFFGARAQAGVGVSDGNVIILALLTASFGGGQFAERVLGKLRAAREIKP